MYEGEYSNGKRNGKGKEYNKEGKLIYEGWLFMGKRWEGKGIIEKGLLIFEGEYRNGQLNGKGKEYNKEGQLIFDGEYKDGKRNGKGKKYKDGQLIFEGNYKSGKANGYIRKYNEGILIFEGNYSNGLKDGIAKEYNYLGNLMFKGEYKVGKRYNGKIYNNKGELESELKEGDGKIKEYDYIRFEQNQNIRKNMSFLLFF